MGKRNRPCDGAVLASAEFVESAWIVVQKEIVLFNVSFALHSSWWLIKFFNGNNFSRFDIPENITE